MENEIKHEPSEEPKLSIYQKMLLNEFQKRPGLMQLLKVLFNDYPQVILVEYITSKGATRRRRAKSLECSQLRMKMEAYIEERLARLAGIDVDSMANIQKEFDEKEKATNVIKADQDLTEAIKEELKKEQDGPVGNSSEGKGEKNA